MSVWPRLVALGAVVLATTGSLTGCSTEDVVHAPATGLIPYAEADLVNPLRGQYENLLTDLFPQANPAQSEYLDWPGTDDVSARIDWRDLQPEDPRTLPDDADDETKFDFARLDEAIAAAADSGKRFGFRITSFNSCCEESYPGDTDISVPDWLTEISGTTNEYEHDGVTYVIPDWNDENYLTYFTDLLAALGRRYNSDERVAIFEMSGYGDFSENHLAFMRDELEMPGPEPDSSVDELGYFSQYRDQYITADSVRTLVDANLSAFPDTQIVAAMGNPQIAKDLLRDSPEVARLRKPVGIRSDSLGAYRPIPTWAENRDSKYVQDADPIVDIVNTRWQSAPIVTEWPPQLLRGGTIDDYYAKGLRDVVGDHVSMTSSTGFPAQHADEPMTPAHYDLWARANKYAGYRYAVVGLTAPETVSAGDDITLTTHWANFGVAPTYENWRVRYEILDGTGARVRTIDSDIALADLRTDQQFTDLDAEPAAATADDTLTVSGGLAAGTYSLAVRVVWDDHKPDASTSVHLEPMQLALRGRGPDGSYSVGRFTVS